MTIPRWVSWVGFVMSVIGFIAANVIKDVQTMVILLICVFVNFLFATREDDDKSA